MALPFRGASENALAISRARPAELSVAHLPELTTHSAFGLFGSDAEVGKRGIIQSSERSGSFVRKARLRQQRPETATQAHFQKLADENRLTRRRSTQG